MRINYLISINFEPLIKISYSHLNSRRKYISVKVVYHYTAVIIINPIIIKCSYYAFSDWPIAYSQVKQLRNLQITKLSAVRQLMSFHYYIYTESINIKLYENI
jgi:hypothetical protein